MYRRNEYRRLAVAGRGGMSLVELMVVLVIISILLSVAWVVLGQTGQAARKAQTLTTIREIDSLLQARLDEFRKNVDEQERKKTRAGTWINILSSAETAGGTEPLEAKKSYVRLDRYRGTFPQRVLDLYGCDHVVGG